MTARPRRGGPFRGPIPATLLAAIVGLAVVALALVAAGAGPLEVHTTPRDPGPPRLAEAPQPPPAPPSIAATPQSASPGGEWLRWVGAALVILIGALLVVWLVVALRRLLRRPARPAVAGTGAPVPASAWAHLADVPEVDLGDARSFRARRSADDIIASWELVEATADALGFARHAAATPTEFLLGAAGKWGNPRIDPAVDAGTGSPGYLEAHAGRDTAAAVLLHLYHRARFDTVTLTPGAASAARRAALLLLETWSAAEPPVGAGAAADSAVGR